MIKARAWSARAMYILIAAALAIGLFITAAPAQTVNAAPDEPAAEWTMVDTPTLDGWVLSPYSVIYDYALASEGDVAYAVVSAYDETCVDDSFADYTDRLLKSDNGAATWTDLTDMLTDQLADDGYTLGQLRQVATDGADPDSIAVALAVNEYTDSPVHVYISNDGGDTFVDTGEVEDAGVHLIFVGDLAVSPEADGKRDIAVGGPANVAGGAGIFRCTATGDSGGAWEDATQYAGWSDDGSFLSAWVTGIIFSPNWATDRTVLVTTLGPSASGPGPEDVYLQSGTWGKTTGAWNAAAGFADAVLIKAGVQLDVDSLFDVRAMAGATVPSDYDGSDPLARYAWVWVDYDDPSTGPTGEIIMVNDSVATPINQQIAGMPQLTNVSYLGTIAEGKAIAGLLGNGAGDFADCCEGIQVYHNNTVAHMNICCEPWGPACKLPTGAAGMLVSYVDANNAGQGKPDKAYAVALYPDNDQAHGIDESAWSVSVDGDGLVWNQLSLVDTYINYISDVAVSPDCNKMMLVAVNTFTGNSCGCDSVWLKATDLPEDEEYSGYWIRTWCGQLTDTKANYGDPPYLSERGLLRLSPDEATGDTVYLVDRGTGTIYYNDLETWNCWKVATSTIDEIVDLAVKDEATIYALGLNGNVAMSDDHGKAITWTDPVDSKVDYGWTIAVNGDYVLVGAQDSHVSYSDDGGETFTLLDKTTPVEGFVTVAFDTYFDTNDTIYAAVAWDDGSYTQGGIYDWAVGTSEDWTDLGAIHNYAYTGLVLSNINGNPFTSSGTGGVLYASWYYSSISYTETGVARSLTPIVAEEACVTSPQTQWDYLEESQPEGLFYTYPSVLFSAAPDALKICGCLTPDTNSKLFAIDRAKYNMCSGQVGTVWTFEDCYAKKAVELTSPADGFVVGASSCGCCNVPFTVKWDRMCDACCYQIEFALDADFTQLVEVGIQDGIVRAVAQIDGDHGLMNIVCPQTGDNPSEFIGPYFQPETTYYWRVRATLSGTGQLIHSWWSDARSFAVSPTAAAGAIELVAPTPGATDVGTSNAAFSWHILATADSFDFVLSRNADLSSPVSSQTGLHGTATSYTGTLSYDTPYYWQVTAYNSGAAISTSAIGTFRTAEAPSTGPGPTPTVTPDWVWVVIGLGAALIIAVIVLMFRVRRA
jgi:hypothetical protein